MKARSRWYLDGLRQKLVLTSEEKRVIIFVLAACLIGLGTKCYRDSHPKRPTTVENKQKSFAPSPSQTPSRKRARKPRSKIKVSPGAADGISPSPSAIDPGAAP